MNFLILGAGTEELAWARAIAGHPGHRLWAAYPGFKEFPNLRGEPARDDVSAAAGFEELPETGTAPRDLDDALATAGVEAIVVGGGPEFRAEGLRRAAAEGLPVICLHPPGPDSEAYYQVALSRAETGAVIVPDLPLRLHPGVEALRQALERDELGAFRGLRHESPGDGDLAQFAFPRAVDVIRALLGEIEDVTATGDPPGDRPTEELVVQLRGPEARRAEVRIGADPANTARLVLSGASGTIALEYDPASPGHARLIRRAAAGAEAVTELEAWSPHDAILDALAAAVAGRPSRPDLLDGTRAMELAEAVVRSLRRGRTVDLHYEEISEEGTFKGVMTSLGCVVLLGVLVALPAALVGPAVGFPETIYIAYAIPPALVGFILLQLLRLGLRKPKEDSPQRHKGTKEKENLPQMDTDGHR
jgi:myo-inositol 2-dehydrogenase/D-chiro-inositol 1-dehydrogenase